MKQVQQVRLTVIIFLHLGSAAPALNTQKKIAELLALLKFPATYVAMIATFAD